MNGSSMQPNIANKRVRKAPGTAPTPPHTSSGESEAETGRAANGRAARAEALAGRAPQGGDAGELEQRAPRSKTEKVAMIGDLLRNGLEGDTGGGDAGDEGNEGMPNDLDPEAGESKSLKLATVAEALGVEVADLYELLELDDVGGKTLTLGALKDLAKEASDLEGSRLEFSELKASEENDLLRRKQELDYILRSLPKTAVTPEVVARATAERTRVLELERARTLEAIPDWKKPGVEKAERAKIGEFMTQYGYDKKSIDQMFDHRMVKLLRDSWQRFERVQDALAKVKEQKAGNAREPSRAGGAPRQPRAVKLGPNAGRTEKVAAIAELLRGAK